MCTVSSFNFPVLRHKQLLIRRFNLVVPSEDSHQSEYIAHCDARRGTYNPESWSGRIAYCRFSHLEFISGFTGSAGTAVISSTAAALSTDGRYFNQAAKQLDSNWTLLKRGLEGVLTWQEWYLAIFTKYTAESHVL